MSLCLNMIVKNESNIIERLLSSVLPIIDTYCICDTGSTDNTIEVINNFFKDKIEGKIIQEPFKNFCYNRNFALKECWGMSDYILLLDADMILEIKDFKKKNLKHDVYQVLQGNDNFQYQNIRIIKNQEGFEYLGVTHEYLNIPQEKQISKILKNELFILDVGDGGSKKNKFERDIKLLTDGLKDEPNNIRYHFYLANSYHDIGDLDNAIKYYEKRVKLGGWKEEVWYSYYRMGLCYQRKGEMEKAISHWLEAYEENPKRLENLYEIIKYYRSRTKYQTAWMFYQMIKDFNYQDDNLFLDKTVYQYKIYQEFIYFAYYVNQKNINQEVVQVLNHVRDNDLILSNMKFYPNVLVGEKINFNLSYSRNYKEKDFHFISSSPCIVKNDNGYLLNIRMVNYRIDENGKYLNVENQIITEQKVYQLDSKFEKISEHQFEINYDENKLYLGVEDIRIFNGKFIGTTQHADGKLGMVDGEYDLKKDVLEYEELKGFNHCEKNWVFYQDKVVYSWFPLTLGQIKNNELEILEKKDMPLIFSRIRGSSCGYQYQNEIWFITHMVSYENPRHYYHLIVVFDEEMNLLRYTAPFKFEGCPIEYSLSLIVEEERVLITHSTWDKTSNIGIYKKNYIEKLFVKQELQ